MNPYDKEKTREIWKRVLNEEESCDCRAFSSERLREHIAASKRAACTYRAMACCTEGKCRNLLCRFAENSAMDAKKLETVYFIWTGKCAGVPAEKAEKVCCLADSLRNMYQTESAEIAMLQKAAEEMPDYASVFYALAQDKRCRLEHIMKLLRCYV